ncbi:MAG: T9SS type A sorting domain-containing protein [Bacteroidota bacterium]|nr:T9SS type A sorting domain-containing protein [Bacteroidota bacterium]
MNNIIKNLAFVLIFLFTQDLLYAQVSVKRDIPKNIKYKSEIKIPEIILPEINYRNIRQNERSYRDSRFKKIRFAEMINVNINPVKDGVLKTLANGDKLFLLKIKSKKAYSLSVYFDLYNLPKGAELFIYNPEKENIKNAFTNRNNKKNKQLAIAPVKGDEILISYFEPKNVDYKGQLHISKIGHDYKNIFTLLNKDLKGFGSSGACNVDINCEEGDSWEREKRSVCKITYNGWMCSGALINNVRNNGKPYFLTANHCIDNQVDADAIIFYFNYDSPTCNGSEGTLDNTLSGSELIATAPNNELDFSLLELSIPPPPEYEPYYAGWNREKEHALKSTCIHHPSGDVKKISKDYNAAEIGDYGEDYNTNSHWWIKDWEVGTTEGGSSGAPLFDENHRIVGDLTGGDASCAYNYNDYFAMFSRSWNEYSENTNQLQKWLDPYNTGITTLDGIEPYDTLPSNLTGFEFSDSIKLTWLPSSDTSGFKKYFIYRNNILLDSTVNLEYNDTTCLKNLQYKYQIAAKFIQDLDTIYAFSNKYYIRLMDALPIPYIQNFEANDSMPEYWYQISSNDTVVWKFKNGGDVFPANAYEGNLNAFFQSNYVDTATLISPKIDLGTTENSLLVFYLVMPDNSNDVARLNVLYKDADSLNWKILKTYSEDIPVWQKQIINLPNLSSQYQVAFQGVGNHGYGIGIDSVSVATDFNPLIPDFAANKSEFCLTDSVKFIKVSGSESDSYYWNFGEDASPENASGAGPFYVKYSSSGLKRVSLTVNEVYTNVKNDIVRCLPGLPKPFFSVNGDTLESTSSKFYQWYLNGEEIAGANKQTYVISQAGYYAVEAINEYACSKLSDTSYVLINDIDYNIFNDNKIKISSNPNNGSFEILTEKVYKGTTDIKIYDLNGSLVFRKKIYDLNKQQVNSDINKSGIYILTLSNKEFLMNIKIVIQKKE